MHTNNFDFLRLVFATFVIITHSYSLSGVPEHDWLYQLSGGQWLFSYVGVRGFFALSGYLIFESLMRCKGLGDYFWKRCLRIFPAYWAVIFITVFAIGWWVSGWDASTYFGHASTWHYLKGNLSLQPMWGIEHVLSDNPYPNALNGSLWTIRYEFLMYVILGSLYFVRNHRHILTIFLGAICTILLLLQFTAPPSVMTWTLPFFVMDGYYITELGLYFFIGSLLAHLKMASWPHKHWILALSTTFITLGIFLGGLAYTQFILLPLWALSFGLMRTPYISDLRKIGDYSYGIYLWAFPIQQILQHFGDLNVLELCLLAIPLSYAAGALSWHLIEKRALSYKDVWTKAWGVPKSA